jgi:uncharacterized membrane protein YdjX (TVP38/TMEM64 family)
MLTQHRKLIGFLGVLALIFVAGWFWQLPTDVVVTYAEENRLLGAVLLSCVMFASTVIAPITTLPLVPVIAPFLGPFTTALASIFGWTAGAVVAFLIARYGGKPLLRKFMHIESIERYERALPQQTHFLLLVMLRIAVPVDALSYLLGFVSTVSLREYILTTLIGVSWFAFAFAYLGDAFYTENYVLFGAVGVASLFVVVYAVWYVWRSKNENT